MFLSDPLTAMTSMPFLVEHHPIDTLMVAGFSSQGEVLARHAFPTSARRPLDEPLLESSLWGADIEQVAVIAYSDVPVVDLRPLVDAWTHQGRTTTQALWAGQSRWRSYLCSSCCTPRGHRYDITLAEHPRAQPVTRDAGWRSGSWNDWLFTLDQVADGTMPDLQTLERLGATLYDIPLRDALLAHSARDAAIAEPHVRSTLDAIARMSHIATSTPTHTCLAAMHYLEGELEQAAMLVSRILDVEEYSLARLLQNGLQMRAPASLLARSFAHFDPLDLLGTDRRVA